MKSILITEFIDQSVYRIDENTSKIIKCIDLLSEDEIWHKPNASANSIANLIIHICGNIRQYAISSLNYTEDKRERELEFTTNGGLHKEKLLQELNQTIDDAKEAIKNIPEEKLLKTRSVQGFNFSAVGIIIHVTEHYSYHTGQIALITKLIKNQDLGFYAGIDLNTKNKTT